MRTLLVGGLCSGVGKTTLVCRLLETLPGWGALKITPVRTHPCEGHPGCRECHGLRGDYEISLDPGDGKETGTDLYARAGAARALWLLGRELGLGPAIGAALRRMGDLPGLVVEGNSFARHGAPDAIVLVAREGLPGVKPRALDLIPTADWVVLNRAPGAGAEPKTVERLLRERGATRVLTLDAGSPVDTRTVAFLAEIRAWARR